MNIEQLIVQCLYDNKQVSLQNIGSFTLNQDVVHDPNSDKEILLPENAISFNPNKKEDEDQVLIDYIKTHTRKMRSLAASDLYSYTTLQKELINIGKALIIPGIGSLQKTDSGDISFIQGKAVERKKENPLDKKITDRVQVEETPPTFSSNQPTVAKGKGLIITTIIIFLLLAGAAAYYFITKDDGGTKTDHTELPVLTDTVTNEIVDQPLSDSTQVLSQPMDSSILKIIIRSYPNAAAAESGATRFRSFGHNVNVIAKDSSHYLLAVPIYRSFSDTTKLVDSLKKIFDFPAYVY